MRGIAGHPADTDRDTGFKKALAEYPDIKVVKEVVTEWDPATGVEQINDDPDAAACTSTASGRRASTTSIVDALKTANARVRADRRRGQRRLREPAPRPSTGPRGRRGDQPAAVGGAGVDLALKILDGQKPADTTVHVTPELWDNTTDAGKAALRPRPTRSSPKHVAARAHDPGLDHVHQGRRSSPARAPASS